MFGRFMYGGWQKYSQGDFGNLKEFIVSQSSMRELYLEVFFICSL